MESLPKIKHWPNLDKISLINPKAGKIRICASGWPKNQKRCWNNKISPPLKISKKQELKCRSKIIIVIHPASTGKDNQGLLYLIDKEEKITV